MQAYRPRDWIPATFAIYILALLLLYVCYSKSGSPHRKEHTRGNHQKSEEICNLKRDHPRSFTKTKASLSLYIPGMLFLFSGLSIVTEEYFLPSLERIFKALDLSEAVADGALMTPGSFAPDLFTSLLATFVTKDDVGLVAVVGNAIFYVLVIIGVSAVIAGKVLLLNWSRLVKYPALYTMGTSLFLFFILGNSKGTLEWWEGLLLTLGYLSYLALMKLGNKRYREFAAWFTNKEGDRDDGNLEIESNGIENMRVSSHDALSRSSCRTGNNFREFYPGFEVRVIVDAPIDENHCPRALRVNSSLIYQRQQQNQGDVSLPVTSANIPRFEGNGAQGEGERKILRTEIPSSLQGKILFPFIFLWSMLLKCSIRALSRYTKSWPLTLTLSIVWIGAISYGIVSVARMIGCVIGVPIAGVGLAALAASTSVPDALASVVAAKKGQSDVVNPSVLGSTGFDILVGLGAPIALGEIIERMPIAFTADPIGAIIAPIAILLIVLPILLMAVANLRRKLRSK